MNPGTIGSLFRLDIRSLLRDRRTVIFSIVLPLVMMPLMLFASSSMERRREQRLRAQTLRVAIAGEDSHYALEAFTRALTRPAPAGDKAQLRYELREVPDPAESLRRGDIELYLEVLHGDAARKAAEDEVKRSGLEDVDWARPPADARAIAIHFRSNSSPSQVASVGMRELLSRDRADTRAELLVAGGLPVPPTQIAVVTQTDVASESQVAGSRVSRFLTALVVFLMLMGGATVASDIIAGEKERGTLETLLTTAAGRDDIVAAKLLVTLSVTLTIIVLELVGMLVYGSLRVVELPVDLANLVTPATVMTLLVLYLPVAALVASTLLMVSGQAKSYKEAQLFFFPLNLLGLVLSLGAVLPGVSLRSAIVAIPVANVSVAVREVLVGRFDWPFLAVAWLVTAGAAVLAARRAARLLAAESFISGGDAEAEYLGGPALFSRRVLRWFAVMWVAIFLASLYAGSLDVRGQVAINLLGIFLGGSLLMAKLYRLDVREAFALRAPHPLVWLAVLIGSPSALVVAVGVARLASYVFPVPPELLEEFAKSLFPEDIPTWQLLVFIAILPGICEELTFRGALLYGLRRRFRPVTLCLVVGAVFGLFHFTLFRLASTAFLGVILSAVTLLSGSIFPAMLWHAMNNGTMVVAAAIGAGSGELPLWYSAAALLPLAVSAWILWRYRRPYPGLRTR